MEQNHNLILQTGATWNLQIYRKTMDLLSHAVILTEEVPLNVGTDENALSMRSASAPLEEQVEEEGEDEVVMEQLTDEDSIGY